MLSIEITNKKSLSELNEKLNGLMAGLKTANPNNLNQSIDDILDDLEALLPMGPGITPSIFLSNEDRRQWKDIYGKLKEISGFDSEVFNKRYVKLMIILLIYAELQ